MTTRKELIELIQAMQLGTQEMLNDAKNDARLIQEHTLFFVKKSNDFVVRRKNKLDNKEVIAMSGIGKADFYKISDLYPVSEK